MNSEVNCVFCDQHACSSDVDEKLDSCSRISTKKALEKAKQICNTDEQIKRMAVVSKSVDKDGYMKWPRVRELIELCKRMQYKKLGIAFCVGLRKEARQLTKILKSHEFLVSTVACSVNGEGNCNPVGQALVINQEKTEFNIVIGLCIGHDVMFTKFSEAPVTTLAVKDRVTCHNPAAVLVNSYWCDTFLKNSK